MDPLADPALDRAEFEHRVTVPLNRVMRSEAPNIAYAMAKSDLVNTTKCRKRIQAYENWVETILSQWDAADESGRRQLVGSLSVDDAKIVKDHSPLL